LSKDDSSSPTVSLESIFLTGVIDAKEGRDILTADIPNAFIQTTIPEDLNGDERIVMKITESARGLWNRSRVRDPYGMWVYMKIVLCISMKSGCT
jgi:hypothetical protein